MKFDLSLEEAVPRREGPSFRHPVTWKIKSGENWAVIGPNGAGKTLLTDMLHGRLALKSGKLRIETDDPGDISQLSVHKLVKYVAFRDIYSLADCSNMYYQQRWNATDAEQAPPAGSLLGGFPREKAERYAALFGIGELLDKRIISLSSGELRKFLITRTLMEEPRVLILDNPYIGLDDRSRDVLNGMLARTARLKGLQTVLVLSNPRDLPDWVDRVLPVRDRECLPPLDAAAFRRDTDLRRSLFPTAAAGDIRLPEAVRPGVPHEVTVRFEKVNVRYGDRAILRDVSWKVRSGEKWALLGENGSGKSTLLSLVCGDNPQAYANDITLFDRRRGTGESIWQIKERIGYLSPEMHTFYRADLPCADIVASGFFDSVGLYRPRTDAQRETALRWLELLQAGHLAERPFLQVSFGEQRLVLLARAFVKNPELLILDEPFHGLDAGRKGLVREVIEAYCRQEGRTLILVSHYTDEIPPCVDRVKRLVRQE